MGFSLSWIALKGVGKDQALELTGLADTDEPDPDNEEPISGTMLPTGWYLIVFDDIAHPLTHPDELARLSEAATVLAGVAEEHVNYSAACLYEGGEEIWRVWHQLDFGDFHLEVEGTPPEPFEAIKAKHFKLREEEGYDAVFSVPVELAAGLCGYAYGQEGDFTCLVEADE